ncbi:bifunctional oligoribonuclease/PAP phosphatase NrnA [Natronomonas gomsonensis]|uniref:DHH family phosphoesterase n=1 Tax=Natronomonas gomsonensis TaxID=1046043 RepID=UPI0015BD09FF|nr:bifunctional oligoribonuclease/PAP phosphatase NrnA [Natronomonas gomsonensis]
MERQAVGEAAAVSQRALDALVQRPELVLLIVFLVAAAFLGGRLFSRYVRRTPGDRLAAALADRDRVVVLMHPNPDPDAMASAMGVAAIAETVGTSAVIQHPGRIRHSENRAFETVLECDFDRIERMAELETEAVVLVDHNEPRGFEGAEYVHPYAVVDHHPGNGEGLTFTDVRPDRGSCASIVAEYLQDRGWSVNHDDDGRTVTPRLATGLLYGIQSDTTAFTRGCTPAEFDAAAYLFPAADADSLDRIANPQVDGETLEVKARAINHRRIDGSFLVSRVGELSNLDALATAAEELVRLEGVSAAVVLGEHEGTLHFSGRSRDDRVHMGKALEKALEPLSDASAGGHARMGGGQASLPAATDGGTPEDIESRLFDAMNGTI